MLKGAIFDMDGLLFDTEKVYQETWGELARERGIRLPEDFKYHICGTSGDLAYEVVSKYFHTADGRAIAEECYARVAEKVKTGVDIKKGVVEILGKFKEAGVKCAVASSSSMEVIAGNLARAGISSCFEAVASGPEVMNGKPAPDIFLLAAERLGLPPEECYVFEDAVNGILAADAAGMKPVMVPDLMQPDEKIRKLCIGVFSDLGQAARAL